jgi:hypothetical protein
LRKVVDRLAAAKPKNFDKAGVTMDLNAAHANGCPLDFQKLLDFPDFDFFHDVYGIARHIDRETGRIGDCFLPRCARRDGTVTDALVSEVPDHD